MKLVNKSKQRVMIVDLGIVVLPDQEVMVPDGYCLRRRAMNGSLRPSIMDQLAPQLKPAEGEDRERYYSLTVDDLKKVDPLASKQYFIDAGMPEGIAEIMARQEVKIEAEVLPLKKKEEEKPVTATTDKWEKDAELPKLPPKLVETKKRPRGRPKKKV